MNDLTVIFLTVNEMPKKWETFHAKHLLHSIGDYPLISISKKPIAMGLNLLDTEKEKSYVNIYRQMLRGAKEATTDYVAIAEDDVLYSKDHFKFFRPPMDTFAYNQSRWSVYTWEPSVFSIKQRISNCTLIAPRHFLIEALEERFAKYPNGDFPPEFVGEVGRARVERGLGVTLRNSVQVYSNTPVIHLNHPNAIEDRQKRGRKRLGQIKAYSIPYWGIPQDIVKHYV